MKPSERIEEIYNEKGKIYPSLIETAIIQYLDEQTEKEVKKSKEYNERVAEFLKHF